MINMNQLSLLSLLGVTMFFTSCIGEAKTNLPKESSTIASGQTKLIKAGQGIVSCSLQDKKRNLWFGTGTHGVYRYDGKSFTHFTTSDGLESNMISSILEDKKGNIWFGTFSGLSHYDGKTFTYIPLSPPTDDFVTSILEDKSGKLWVGTNHDLFCYDGKNLSTGLTGFIRFLDDKSIINSNGLKLQVVQCMLEDKQGNIWFTTKDEGVCRYDGKAIVNYTPNDITWFRGLLEDEDGNIWVGGRYSGVFRYDGKSFTNIPQNGRFDSYVVLSIIQDKTGDLWFGTPGDPKRETEGGVWRYDGETFRNFSTEDGLSHIEGWSLLEDKAGNIWAGLSRFDGKTFTSFSE